MLNITPLHPLFAARIEGVDAAHQVAAPVMAALRDALDRYAVLVLPGQHLDDAAQIAFSEGFGALEMTRAGALGAGSAVIVLTNIGPLERLWRQATSRC
ncbi:MAG: TauD/TfdA family dioxygenase [Roseomonas sp.]|nr:TauD/TfdA family dioxygenase [Roseomonas sp.]